MYHSGCHIICIYVLIMVALFVLGLLIAHFVSGWPYWKTRIAMNGDESTFDGYDTHVVGESFILTSMKKKVGKVHY